MRRALISLTLAGFAAFLVCGLAAGDDDAGETSKLAPEALLCLKLAKKDVIRGRAVEPYMELLADGDVEGWNAQRKKDGGKVLDLAARTWDPKGRDDLVLKLEGLDLKNADLSNVIFMPGTSFAFSDLTGASFRGSCLEGVKFSSVWGFDERPEKQVRSTCLENADFREVVWSWCAALERTVNRCGTAKRHESAEAKRKRVELEQQRIMEQLRRLQTGGGSSDVFAFCDTEGLELDKDAPVQSADDDDPPANGQRPRTRTVERLIRASRQGTLARAIDKLAARRHTARTHPCPNPLKAEPVLAAAIAAANSSLAGIETWKAVTLAEAGGHGEDATILADEQVVLVVDNPRIAASTPLLVTRGPIFAWRTGYLPLTFSSSAIVLKDQARTGNVIHGRPIFALSDLLHPERRGAAPIEGAGTFHSTVIVEVPGVENLSEAEAERRALQEAKLKDYAQVQGDLWEGTPTFDPTKDTDGVEPAKALAEDIRSAIESEVGKDALSGMQCFKLPKSNQALVISNDPKAILVVPGSYQGNGAIYSEGPVVFLEGKTNGWIQKCVSKSWVVVKGEAHVGQFNTLGKRVDVEGKKDE